MRTTGIPILLSRHRIQILPNTYAHNSKDSVKHSWFVELNSPGWRSLVDPTPQKAGRGCWFSRICRSDTPKSRKGMLVQPHLPIQHPKKQEGDAGSAEPVEPTSPKVYNGSLLVRTDVLCFPYSIIHESLERSHKKAQKISAYPELCFPRAYAMIAL